MLSTIDDLNGATHMKSTNSQACEAWQLLLRFFFAQRADLPSFAAEFELSPAQCHVLHLIEPGQPIPMGRLAETLACDASNVTGLVDRLESRGLLRRRASAEDRRVKALELTPTGVRLRTTVLDRMTKAIRHAPHHRYSPDTGIAEFRETAAAWFSGRFGVTLDGPPIGQSCGEGSNILSGWLIWVGVAAVAAFVFLGIMQYFLPKEDL